MEKRKYVLLLVFLVFINQIYPQTKVEPDSWGLSCSYSYSFYGVSSILVGPEIRIITTNNGLFNFHNPLSFMTAGFYYKYSFEGNLHYLIINYSILPMIFPHSPDSLFMYFAGINSVYNINDNIFGITPELGISVAGLFTSTYRYNIIFDKNTGNTHEIGIKVFIELRKLGRK